MNPIAEWIESPASPSSAARCAGHLIRPLHDNLLLAQEKFGAENASTPLNFEGSTTLGA